LGRDVSHRLDTLEFNLSRLLLIVQTPGQICSGRNIFTEEEFDSLLRAISTHNWSGPNSRAISPLKSACVPDVRLRRAKTCPSRNHPEIKKTQKADRIRKVSATISAVLVDKGFKRRMSCD
jgi:hypothetical protein